MAYHRFNEGTPDAFGSFETFRNPSKDERCNGGGWYWQACFPGCLPDGEPSGPFATEADAINDANQGA
jgi:hypothetical protein